MKVVIDTTAGNKALNNGRLPEIMQHISKTLKPEAEYYTSENGQRSAFIFFDLKDPSDLPSICEPLYMELNAKIEFFPAMNKEDLTKGLEKWAKTSQKELVHN